MGIVKPAQQTSQGRQHKVPGWIPPPVNMVKINVDVALSKNTRGATAAAIARDGAGVFLGALVLVLDGVMNPEIMEALACREGLALASDLALHRVRLTCDSANVVRSIRGDGKDAYGYVVHEIQAMKGDFTELDIVHEGRDSNVDAHKLARSSLYFEIGRRVLFLSPLEGICNSIQTTNQ
ncbi:unnamed protein product [Urochloa humidicola]